MNTMTGKEVLRAIADGADMYDFEYRAKDEEWERFQPHDWTLFEIARCHAYEYRRKPRTRVVNGFTVPAAIQEMPDANFRLFYVHVGYPDWCFETGFSPSNEHDQNYFYRGLLFSTKEAAIANAKAMCGIDPEAE